MSKNKYFNELFNLKLTDGIDSTAINYKQFAELIKNKIFAAEMPRSFILPSLRKIARENSISRGVVSHALDLLVNEGYIIKGAKHIQVAHPHDKSTYNWMFYIKRDEISTTHEEAFKILHTLLEINGTNGANHIHTEFGFTKFRSKIMVSASEKLSHVPVQIHKNGKQDLIKLLQNYLAQKGITAKHPQIAVFHSNLVLISFLSRILEKNNITCLIPESCRISIRRAFHTSNLGIRYVKCDAHGPIPHNLYTHIKHSENPALFLEPSILWPSGQPIEHERLMEIIEMCNKKNVPLIENDHYHEQCSHPYQSMKSRDQANNILYLSGMFTSFNMANQLAFAVGPEELVSELCTYSSRRYPAPYIVQLFAEEALRHGGYAEFINQYKHMLHQRYIEVNHVLNKYMINKATWTLPQNDIYLALDFGNNINRVHPGKECGWFQGKLTGIKKYDKAIIITMTSCPLKQFECFIKNIADKL